MTLSDSQDDTGVRKLASCRGSRVQEAREQGAKEEGEEREAGEEAETEAE